MTFQCAPMMQNARNCFHVDYRVSIAPGSSSAGSRSVLVLGIVRHVTLIHTERYCSRAGTRTAPSGKSPNAAGKKPWLVVDGPPTLLSSGKLRGASDFKSRARISERYPFAQPDLRARGEGQEHGLSTGDQLTRIHSVVPGPPILRLSFPC